ncbi:MAG: DUF2809 domain-containing protein [Clostridia bacterium]|nr:DUF2809 domain-containing protein [Clostridia bacterium]
MNVQRSGRPFFAAALVLLCVSGILVRRWSGVSPNFFNVYFPDTAWTMAVYCGFGLLFDRGTRRNFPAALGVSYLVELSQLLHFPLLDALRRTVLGGLILGSGFLWSDILCYTGGACVCAAAEMFFRYRRRVR